MLPSATMLGPKLNSTRTEAHIALPRAADLYPLVSSVIQQQSNESVGFLSFCEPLQQSNRTPGGFAAGW